MKFERDDITFFGRLFFRILPIKFVDTFKDTATPDVSNVERFIASGVVVTITNFLGGSDGQAISILGDGTTTVQNNTNIKTKNGFDSLLGLDIIYRFTYFESRKRWYQDGL